MRHNLLTSLAMIALCGGGLAAQESGGIRLTLRPESRLWIEGTSTVHDWTCASTGFDTAIAADAGFAKTDLAALSHSIQSAQVTVPVKSLKCGHGKMDDNMYKALKAEQYPTISFALTSWEVLPGATRADSFTVRATGKLTIAGVERAVAIDVVAGKHADGRATARGELPILMTDYGMKPVTAMLGTIKTGNRVVVKFDVAVTAATAVAAAAGGR
jgi:hypothetical protein